MEGESWKGFFLFSKFFSPFSLSTQHKLASKTFFFLLINKNFSERRKCFQVGKHWLLFENVETLEIFLFGPCQRRILSHMNWVLKCTRWFYFSLSGEMNFYLWKVESSIYFWRRIFSFIWGLSSFALSYSCWGRILPKWVPN